jgi:opacity protein-like surface antigen
MHRMNSMKAPFGWTLSLAVALGLSTAAGAQEPEPRAEGETASTMSSEELTKPVRAKGRIGPQFAISGNVGLGAGYVYKNGTNSTGTREDLKITDSAKVSIPVLAEVGFRATPHFYVGVWGSWEKVFTKRNETSCPEGFDCNTQQWRFGPEIRYHFAPDAGFDPYLGLGVGLEFLKSHVKGETQIPVAPGVVVPARVDTRVTDRGPTFARVTLGGDVRVTRALAVGPILTASIGSYTVRTGSQTLDITGVGQRDGTLARVDDGFHALFTVGVRLAFLPL